MAHQSRNWRRRETVAPNHLAADAIVATAGLGLGATLANAVVSLTSRMLHAPGGLESALGGITGLTGTYLVLMMVVLVGRLAPLERLVGQPRLTMWHRRLAPWPLLLLTAHAVLSILAFAALQRAGAWHVFALAVSHAPGMLGATVGLCLLVLIAAASIRAARRRLSHEAWWHLHLLTYLALALSFSHQLALGTSFAHHPLARAAWTVLWFCTAGIVLAYRIGLPLWRSAYHGLRVEAVREESPDVYSLIVSGRRLDRLAVAGGQYFHWRFIARGLWLHAHPYSISALPDGSGMRVTIKALGKHSRRPAKLSPGTRIVVEGPYGTFTKHALRGSGVALIGAGVGVTPVRALLEDLPETARPVVLLRASSEEDLVLAEEVRDLVRARNGRAHPVLGSRDEAPLDGEALRRHIPDLLSRDLFICGPESFTRAVASAARQAGVPRARLHTEGFAY